MGQKLWFTPPHIGKILNTTELYWAVTKWHYKRTPANARKGDKQALSMLWTCLNKTQEVGQSMRKPAQYTRAILVAARDGVQVEARRCPGSEPKALLIPEVYEAVCNFGRELRRGDADTAVLGAEVPAGDGDSLLDNLILSLDDVGAAPADVCFEGPLSAKRVQEERDAHGQQLASWTAYLGGQDPRAARAAEEKTAKRARKEQRAEVREAKEREGW